MSPLLLLEFERKYGVKENVRIIKYEDMIDHSDNHIKDFYRWLGIAYNKKVLDYKSNTSYKGKYGDPFGVNVNNMPSKKFSDNWKQKLDNPKFSDWLHGYGAYLGQDFLCKYGYNDEINYKNNLKFRLFSNYCYKKEKITKSSWKDFIVRKLIKYYIKEDI